jgi:hypothetical protein
MLDARSIVYSSRSESDVERGCADVSDGLRIVLLDLQLFDESNYSIHQQQLSSAEEEEGHARDRAKKAV